jgi:hypothetical protein
LVRLVLRLSRLGKIAATVAGIGGLLAVYGRLANVPWAALAGSLLLFGGALVYFVERWRMVRRRRD